MVTNVCFTCIESISSAEGKTKGNRRNQIRTGRRSANYDNSQKNNSRGNYHRFQSFHFIYKYIFYLKKNCFDNIMPLI